jgi:RNA polymerase sigma factor (TIGR02999 family)
MSSGAGAGRAATVTTLLGRLSGGDPGAASQLAREVYDELHELARGRFERLPPGQTLQTTDLVHEAWLRLGPGSRASFEDRVHFFGAASNAMRNVLVDRARRKGALKRTPPGEDHAVEEQELEIEAPVPLEDVLALHEALERLEVAHERAARIVLLRFFGGLSLPEVAELTGVSLATAERDWRFARSWLQRELRPDERGRSEG